MCVRLKPHFFETVASRQAPLRSLFTSLPLQLYDCRHHVGIAGAQARATSAYRRRGALIVELPIYSCPGDDLPTRRIVMVSTRRCGVAPALVAFDLHVDIGLLLCPVRYRRGRRLDVPCFLRCQDVLGAVDAIFVVPATILIQSPLQGAQGQAR